MVTFSEVVDAADNLSLEEQETLIEILSRRIAELNRQSLVRDVANARSEFNAGKSRPTTVADLMDEVRSES